MHAGASTRNTPLERGRSSARRERTVAALKRAARDAIRATGGVEGDETHHDGAARSEMLDTECERFIEAHQRAVLNYLWRMTGDEQAAYDLTQEVFVRAWQRFDTVRTYERPRSWLLRVATNLALTYLKRRTTRIYDTTSLDDQLGPATSDPAWRLAESDHVRSTLLRLAPKRRGALVLCEVYGLSAAEVGQALGMSEAAVRMALHRAREQFRELYSREGGTSRGS